MTSPRENEQRESKAGQKERYPLYFVNEKLNRVREVTNEVEALYRTDTVVRSRCFRLSDGEPQKLTFESALVNVRKWGDRPATAEEIARLQRDKADALEQKRREEKAKKKAEKEARDKYLTLVEQRLALFHTLIDIIHDPITPPDARRCAEIAGDNLMLILWEDYDLLDSSTSARAA